MPRMQFTYPALPVAMFLASVGTVAAQEDWELLPNYPDSAYQLWAHQNGPVFALGQNALYRSDDLGETWQPLDAPPNGRVVAVDPINDQTLYARAAAQAQQGNLELLERSDDNGTTWRTLLSYSTGAFGSSIPPLTGYPPQRFAVSPTRNDVLYAYAGEQLEHSADGGATWQPGQSISHAGSPCTDVVDVLQVDPQDPRRLFTDAGCYAGRDFGFNVSQSFDGGATFSRFFDQGRGFETAASGPQPVTGYPCCLVGGSGRW